VDDARIDIQPVGTAPRFSLVVKRNCSIAPRALAALLALTACLSFGIGIGFAAIGAWPILPFTGLEIAALAAAFYLNGRHAADYERIALEGGMLVVEVRVGQRTDTHRFNPHWVRLVASGGERNLRLALRSHGKELEIGRHLDAPGRALLAAEVRGRLARASIGSS
jgi:uncharacterized membrane protein